MPFFTLFSLLTSRDSHKYEGPKKAKFANVTILIQQKKSSFTSFIKKTSTLSLLKETLNYKLFNLTAICNQKKCCFVPSLTWILCYYIISDIFAFVFFFFTKSKVKSIKHNCSKYKNICVHIFFNYKLLSLIFFSGNKAKRWASFLFQIIIFPNEHMNKKWSTQLSEGKASLLSKVFLNLHS